jgi:murein L,D-transpeptidase YafK
MRGARRVVGGAVAVLLLASADRADAFRIELKDVASDRIERQRAEAQGMLPLPGTPNIAQLEERLKEKGLVSGAPVFIRAFKAESELEVWMLKGDRSELFATYPVCHWSGTLGPKTAEGDKQTPEGVYTVTRRQVHASGRHPKALNLGFPNALDRQFQRTGSYILIHGGCGSVGCFAMTNPVIDEIHAMSLAALKNGQAAIQVHTYPFRLTEANLTAHALHPWYEFWRNLKDVYDAFEQTKRPPRVSVCDGRYWVESETEVASQDPLAVCGARMAASPNGPKGDASLASSVSWSPQPMPSALPPSQPALEPSPPLALGPLPRPARNAQPSPPPLSRLSASAGRSVRSAAPPSLKSQVALLNSLRIPISCGMRSASCRKWIAGQVRVASTTRRLAAAPTASARAR